MSEERTVITLQCSQRGDGEVGRTLSCSCASEVVIAMTTGWGRRGGVLCCWRRVATKTVGEINRVVYMGCLR